MRLFLARVRAARPGLVEDAALATTAKICRDLDGLPLAIELAAARAKALSLEDIAARIAYRFRILASWRRLSPARHRTLKEAIDWSYDLLAEDERVLLARLSVFAGGFTLAAVEAVALESGDAADVVGQLVEASLVVPDQGEGESRYRLLETIRQYAAEQLEERGETALFKRGHGEYFLALAEQASHLQVSDFDMWVDRLAADHDNLRTALAWCRDAAEPEYLLRLATAIWKFWWVRGDFAEGRSWLDTALERGRDADPGLRTQVLEGGADLAWAHGDLARAGELAESGRSLFAAIGDGRGEIACTTVLGHVALARSDFRAAARPCPALT